MTTAFERSELERLRSAVGEQIGFGFEDDRLEQLGLAVRGRVTELGLTGFDAYVARLRAAEHRVEETRTLAELLTVTETFFCRNQDQFQAFVEAVVPERQAQGGRRLRIVSAGCASGEEPYSIAIALIESLPDIEAWDIEILGLDVNRAMLTKAARARYSPWSLRSTPEPIKARYFRADGNEFVLVDAVKTLVKFREHNLAETDTQLFRTLKPDAIFCRNVIMYFAPEVMRRVVEQLTAALSPGGFLFLGHAETLRGLSHAYHLCHTHGTFYYQRREGEPARALPSSLDRSPTPRELEALPDAVEAATSWFEAIQAATNRVTALTTGRADPSRAGNGTTDTRPPAAPAPQRSELGAVLELMQRERFSEALALLEALPAAASDHPDALLLSAVLLTNHGRLAEAERACEKLLAVDDLNAGAHYLEALCREHAGDTEGAAEHDRIAVHLDPTFAMPHLHAGLMAKRSGDSGAARRELAQALILLEREDTSRLVLFGGGFSREALTLLCRTELARLGGSV